jgi:hypothetical protein
MSSVTARATSICPCIVVARLCSSSFPHHRLQQYSSILLSSLWVLSAQRKQSIPRENRAESKASCSDRHSNGSITTHQAHVDQSTGYDHSAFSPFRRAGVRIPKPIKRMPRMVPHQNPVEGRPSFCFRGPCSIQRQPREVIHGLSVLATLGTRAGNGRIFNWGDGQGAFFQDHRSLVVVSPIIYHWSES